MSSDINDPFRGGFGASAHDPASPEPVEEAQPPITLERARRYFLESTNATQENDLLCVRDANYFHGKQLSAEVRNELKQRGQPLVIMNRIKPAIDGMLGVIDGMETQPECLPLSLDLQNQADVATKALRYLGKKAKLTRVRKNYSKDFFIEGTCAVLVGDGAEEGDKEFAVTPIHWEDFFYDPFSREHDFYDARYIGFAKWCDVDAVKQAYPEQYAALGNPLSFGDDFLGKDTLAERRVWVDMQRKRLRVVELYVLDGQGIWQRLCFCHAGFLDFGPSAYKDDNGRSLCPIVAASYEVDRYSGDRYGAVRNLVSPQDELNSRRSAMLNLTHNRKVRILQEGIDPTSKEIAKREAAKADGVLPYGTDIVPTPDIFQQNAELLRMSDMDFDRHSPSPAVMSQFAQAESGRAKQILQEAGLSLWARGIGYLEALEEEIYRRLWLCAKQYMTARTLVHVTNDVHAPEAIEVNKPVMGMVPQPVLDPQSGQPVTDPHTGRPAMHMALGVVGMENEIAQIDVDIELTTVTPNHTLEQEAIDSLLSYAQSCQISPLSPEFKAVLMMFPFPDKQKVLDRWDQIKKEMSAEVAEQQQAQAQAAQQQQQLHAQDMQTKAQRNAAQAHKLDADAARIQFETQQAAHREVLLNGALIQGHLPQLPQ